jgi:hypothetical protein
MPSSCSRCRSFHVSEPSLIHLQLYDVMLLEHKPLVEVTNQELAEAPLLFLACGHIFPRDSLDGLVELGKAYSADDAGRWLAPLPLQVLAIPAAATRMSCACCRPVEPKPVSLQSCGP